MASYSTEAPVLDTYQAVVSAYCDFLTVAIHTILYERNIYPQTSFIKARKYNYPCTIAQTSLIIHAPPPSSQPLERYVFSTASFPRIPPSETLTPFAPETSTNEDAEDPENPPVDPTTTKRFDPPPTSDLPEQFRATFARLSTSLSGLRPLPEDCSFTLAIELRDEDGVEAPIGREGGWIAAEPGLQRERKGREQAGVGSGGGLEGSKKGKDLGGVKTTPVRSLEAGAFRMEVWVEEGRGKFQAQVEDERGDYE
ncbi:mitotic spindle assembly checkpoint protein MAD2B, partial [Lecanoromycetidae sp. Uapishka_2]